MKLAVLLVAALSSLAIALGMVAYLVGRRLPEAHVAEGHVLVSARIERVAARVREVESHPGWRQVDSIVIEARELGRVRYREFGGDGEIVFELSELEPERLFENRIVSQNLPYGGRWLIRLEAQDDGATRVEVREEGLVHAPLYRALGKYVLGHDRSLKTYLAELARSFSSHSDGT